MRVKFGDGNRIVIPAQIREELNLVKGEFLEMTLDGNKIILQREKNDSESDQDNEEVEEPHVEEVYKPPKEDNQSKSKLQEALESVQKETYWDNGILKHKIKEEPKEEKVEVPKEDAISNLTCDCGNLIGTSRFIINDKVVCRECRDALRDKLILDIKYKKRLKELHNQ